MGVSSPRDKDRPLVLLHLDAEVADDIGSQDQS